MSLTQVEASPTLPLPIGHMSPPGLEHMVPKSPMVVAPSRALGKFGLWAGALSPGSPIPTPLLPHLGIVTPSPMCAAAAPMPREMASLLSLLPPPDEVEATLSHGLPTVQERDCLHGTVAQDKQARESSDKTLLRCCLCDTTPHHPCSNSDSVTIGRESESSGDGDISGLFVDGRFVCDSCRTCFEPADFVPQYHVCVNPLCRRKWKQLTPKVLPLFCPPCKRHLEQGTDAQGCKGALIEKMYRRWHAIFTELAGELGYAEPPPLIPEEPECDAAKQSGRWRTILTAFRESFPVPPNPNGVRNWNSVHGRRKHYRGVIHRGPKSFVCTIEALEELQEDGVTVTKSVAPGSREYAFLDWFGNLQDGQEVSFIAFPNPAVAEREHVSRIIKILEPQGDGASREEGAVDSLDVSLDRTLRSAPKAIPSRFNDDGMVAIPVASAAELQGSSQPPAAAPDAFADSFCDLMQWSTGDCAAQMQLLEEPMTPSAHPPHVAESTAEAVLNRAPITLSLVSVLPMPVDNPAASTAIAKSYRGLDQRKHRQQSRAMRNPLTGHLPGSTGRRSPPQRGATAATCRASAASFALTSPAGMQRSPGWMPRSPFASYFDD